MRVIDFRLRPPLRAFLEMVMYSNIGRTEQMARGIGMELPESVRRRSVELMLGEMDEAGVQWGVVPGRISPVLGTIEADDIAAIVAAHPRRLIGYAGIDPVNQRKAIAAIDAALAMGMKGVVIEPGLSSTPMHLDDARMYPIYAHCDALQVVVLFMAGGNAGPDITYTSPEHIDRVARDFPGLRIISGHGNWPWAAQIIHVCYRRPNIWLSPDMYIFGGMPGAQDYINAANGFLSERFLFGTAYPLLPFKDGVDGMLRLGLKESVADRVMYKNAANLLGLGE
jgi:predicted TIM-barrel fold metal-dependent hydrolase